MNGHLLTILTGLLWTSNLLGQIQNDAKKILETKDFVAFKKFADHLSDQEGNINSFWECLRDLTSDFQEGVFFIEKTIPQKDNPAISSVYTYRINIIATKTQIAYYDLSEEKNKKVENDWQSYHDPIANFKDDKIVGNLKNSFKSIFQIDLNENELFITDFVYGEHCGFAGVNPEGRQQIETFVMKEDKTELLKWLKSTNTEKQIYAVDGLSQLKERGIKLTKEDLKMIKFVTNKNGTMHVCSGCLQINQEISSVTKKFKF